jgi:hypothetical protein
MHESRDDERCYYCGPVGNILDFDEHVEKWGNMIMCSWFRKSFSYGQKENNDSTESSSGSTGSDSEG